MGEVYRARDTRLNRTVAIKALPAHLRDNADLRQRFEREAQAVAALNHPHICTLHDIGHHEGVDFLVMEYLEGETLADRLARKAGSEDPVLSSQEVLRYAIEIAKALDHAHRKGITHRDLKPSNIMVTTAGAKVLDFGLAKLCRALALPSNRPRQPKRPVSPRWERFLGRCNTWRPSSSKAKRPTLAKVAIWRRIAARGREPRFPKNRERAPRTRS
jgi:serine/threonine protein kinase